MPKLTETETKILELGYLRGGLAMTRHRFRLGLPTTEWPMLTQIELTGEREIALVIELERSGIDTRAVKPLTDAKWSPGAPTVAGSTETG
jgi:hypothetical protein